VGSSKKRAINERNNEAGSRRVPVHNAKVLSKPGKTTGGVKDILERETSNVRPFEAIASQGRRETSDVKSKKQKSKIKREIKNKTIKKQ
jgi:hypothetical protein